MARAIDYPAITAAQQRVWALGDFGHVGSRVILLGEVLVRDLDVLPGERVLDVAAGNGNAALAAARRFADVLATDYVPELLTQAERRAEAEGLLLATQVADAQALPFPDGSFDVVLSAIGAMFAPDHERVADELVRVCRVGGRIGMANWTPTGWTADLFRAIARHRPPPPGVAPPTDWGREERVRELFGDRVELRLTRATVPIRYPSVPFFVDYFGRWFGPVRAAFESLDEPGRQALREDLQSTLAPYETRGGVLAAEAEYLEVVAERR